MTPFRPYVDKKMTSSVGITDEINLWPDTSARYGTEVP